MKQIETRTEKKRLLLPAPYPLSPVSYDRSKLLTERQNPSTRDIDANGTLEIVDIINQEDKRATPAV